MTSLRDIPAKLRHADRRLLAGMAVAFLCALSLAPPVTAQESKFLRIGTGAIGGTYFPVGGLIANAISSPPGSRSCEAGGSCGVPGLIAVTQSTQGSVENVIAVGGGELETALTQADIAYFAYFGKGVLAKQGRLGNLRAIANLFPEMVHLVVRRESAIWKVAGFKGNRVNLGEKGSGTLVGAGIILAAHGLKEADVKSSHYKVGKASDLLRAGKIDAYFMFGGVPLNAVAVLAETGGIRLLPIAGKAVAAIRKEHPFFAENVIAEGAYKGIGAVATLSVGALWVTRLEVNADLVYGITRALWHPRSRRVLDGGHPQGRRILLKKALNGVAIPIHPGAMRYYEEAGLTRAPLE